MEGVGEVVMEARTFGFSRRLQQVVAALFIIGCLLLVVLACMTLGFASGLLNVRDMPPAAILLQAAFVIVLGGIHFVAWVFRRRVLARTYTIESRGLILTGRKKARRVEFSPATVVSYRRFGALRVRTEGTLLKVPLALESFDEMVRLLREQVVAAGGSFSEETYHRAVAEKLSSAWQARHVWVWILTLPAGAVALMAPATHIASEHGDTGCLAAMAAVLLWACCALGAVLFVLPRPFERWNEPGWRAPGAGYAWGMTALISLASAAITAGVLAAVFL